MPNNVLHYILFFFLMEFAYDLHFFFFFFNDYSFQYDLTCHFHLEQRTKLSSIVFSIVDYAIFGQEKSVTCPLY
jgi:hypothetical protein